MLALEMITWWYSEGWLGFARRLWSYVKGLYNYFSVALLAKTLFAPWKRITTYGSRSVNERLRAMADNLVSRMVGFSVRLMVLVAGLILILFSLIVGLVGLVVWPLIPIAIPVLIIRTVLPV